MLDKTKYFPLVALSGIMVRSVVYPLTLIKTRMQIQKSRNLYTGTIPAAKQILRQEGFKGLYSGFLVQNLSIFSQLTFLTTYERIRFYLADQHAFKNNQLRAFIAGGCASIVAQTIVVPIDITVQHLQTQAVYPQLVKKTASISNSRFFQNLDTIQNTKLNFRRNNPPNDPSTIKRPIILSPANSALSTRTCIVDQHSKHLNKSLSNIMGVVTQILQKHGWRGFYKGFSISVLIYTPTSAIWWLTYDTVCGWFSFCLKVLNK